MIGKTKIHFTKAEARKAMRFMRRALRGDVRAQRSMLELMNHTFPSPRLCVSAVKH
jgi:hypothetical protein